MLSANVKRARIECGMKQQDLAARVGLSQSSLSLIEAGLRNPRRTTVLMLALALNCRPEDLIGKGADHAA